MFERLEKPFLTVETGEAYQPVRIAYDLVNPSKVRETLNHLPCTQPKERLDNGWDIFWGDEWDDMHFESLDSYKRRTDNPVRLGSFLLKDNTLYLNLPSFKRACLLVPKLHSLLDSTVVRIKRADFINKVFGLSERLPHGFAEMYDEEELDKVVRDRIHDYEDIHARCAQAETAEEAFQILAEYTEAEARKRLPYAERYVFHEGETSHDDAYLGFYIFLRSRELVAIRRWYGETGFTLGDAIDDTISQVFGDMDIDIIE